VNPLYLREHWKIILRNAIRSDTSFLAKMNIMDYSLLVGIDEESQELTLGIVGKQKIENEKLQ